MTQGFSGSAEDVVREQQRMAAVRRYDILDTPPDGAFDRIAALAARLLDVPIAIVSVVDTDRIWFKSHHGLDVSEIGREPGLCASAILGSEPWLVTVHRLMTRRLAASRTRTRLSGAGPAAWRRSGSRTQEPEVERAEHEDYPDIHGQPRGEQVPEEQDVHGD